MIAAGKRAARWLAHRASPTWEAWLDDYRELRSRPRSAGDFRWRPLRRSPDVRLDAGRAVIGPLLHIVGGVASPDRVLDVVDVFDMRSRRWAARVPMPVGMAQSHSGVACDDTRYMFAISGQLGNQCRPPTTRSFALDTARREWFELPPLPEARYAPTAQLWRGRLHVLGGSREDRGTPACDHWSLGIEQGRARDTHWRPEPPIPIGGPHRASAVIADRLYVFGGQLGHYVAIPGDPDYRCTGTLVREEHYADCFVLEVGASAWAAAAPMPVAVSHTESSIVVVDGAAYLFGGQCALTPTKPELAVTDVVQRYEPRADRWSRVGSLPYAVKTCVGYYDGWLFAAGGQRDRDRHDQRPGAFVSQCWGARLV